MGWILRRSTDRINPTLSGGVYGYYKTAGRGVFWYFDGARVRFILFIADGGRYGLGDLSEVSYKKVRLAPEDYKYHRGRFTKQIEPQPIQSANASTNAITAAAHPFADDQEVRLHARGGTLPAPLVTAKKYFVVGKTTNTFQLSELLGGAAIDLTTAGSGTITAWRVNAGFDDPEQGLPTFCPQVETAFSGIAYIEGKLPAQYNTDAEPDWQDFRVGGLGRRLMDYDGSGAEVGVVASNADLLTNPALCDADCLIVDYRKPLSRFDWASWYALRTSALVKVVQSPDFSQSGSGLIGNYCAFAGAVSFENVIFSRRDAQIDFNFGTDIPAPELPNTYYAIRWEGYLKSKYTETYAINLNHDDGARVWINGTQIINSSGVGNESPTFPLTADVAVPIKIEFWNEGGPGNCNLKWSSPSQPLEVIPVQALYEKEITVNRYQYSGAAAAPVEAADMHEQIMLRCPGWDWTDENGKIVYLPPTRPVAYEFLYDAEDPDAPSTFLEKTFQKSRRPRRDRKNFVLYSFRNQILSYYPEEFCEENRPRLRELAGGVPNNDAPKDLLVMTRSLAQRIADLDMKINSDPSSELSLAAQKSSGMVTKRKLVRVRNWVKGDNRIEDAYCLVRSVEWGGNRLQFVLVPVPYPFYADVEAV